MSNLFPAFGGKRLRAGTAALQPSLPAQLNCGLVLVWVCRRRRRTIFDLASENVTDQFAKLNGIAGSLEAISCHNRSIPRFGLRTQTGEIETVPLPGFLYS